MARRLTTGAEETDCNGVWDSIGLTVSPTPVIWGPSDDYGLSNQPRTGRGMYVLRNDEYLRRNCTDMPTELYYGFAMCAKKIENQYFFYSFTDDVGVFDRYCRLRALTDGTLEFWRGGVNMVSSVSGVITANNWHYIEVWHRPLNADGRFVVKVDGVIAIDYTGDTTDEEEYINGWQLQGNSNDVGEFTLFDDIVCNDTSGPVNNSWPGQVRLLPIRPAAAGTFAQWDRAGVDLGTDHAHVRQDFDFAMLQTSTPDERQTFTPDIPDLPAGATIQNIIVNVRARVENGSGVVAPMVRSHGTDAIGSDHTLSSAYHWHAQVWPDNPDDSAPWEEGDLANLEIGFSS